MIERTHRVLQRTPRPATAPLLRAHADINYNRNPIPHAPSPLKLAALTRSPNYKSNPIPPPDPRRHSVCLPHAIPARDCRTNPPPAPLATNSPLSGGLPNYKSNPIPPPDSRRHSVRLPHAIPARTNPPPAPTCHKLAALTRSPNYKSNPIRPTGPATSRRPVASHEARPRLPNEPTVRLNSCKIALSSQREVPRRCLATRKNEPIVETGQRKKRRCFPPTHPSRSAAAGSTTKARRAGNTHEISPVSAISATTTP